MNISDIKAAVEAARERQAKELQDCPFCGRPAERQRFSFNSVRCDDGDCPGVSGADKSDWNHRPAQEQADTALIALWEMMQPEEQLGMVPPQGEMIISGGWVPETIYGRLEIEQEASDAAD